MARIAVSGAGWWGQGWHLPHLSRHPDAIIAAIVEPNPSPVSSNAAQVLESTAQLSSRYSAPVYGSVGELLASTTELDGLLVGSPHASHFADGMLAIEAGVHVLMEKPMTTSVDEARALAAAARAHIDAGRFFAVNNTANWRTATRAASAAVAAGRVGQVQHVAARMHSPLLWLFDEPANAGWVAPTGDMVGNGFGWGQLSHLLAWCFEVSGLQPEAAFTSMQHSARTGADLHVAAVVTCVGGASIALSGSAGLPGDAHGKVAVGKQIEVAVAVPTIALSPTPLCVRTACTCTSFTGLRLRHGGVAPLRRRRPAPYVGCARITPPRHQACARGARSELPL